MLPYSLTPESLFEDLLPRRLREGTGPLRPGGAVELGLEDDGGLVWTVDLDARTVNRGASPRPALQLRAQGRDLLALLAGRMSVEDALLTERLSVTGEGGNVGTVIETLKALVHEHG